MGYRGRIISSPHSGRQSPIDLFAAFFLYLFLTAGSGCFRELSPRNNNNNNNNKGDPDVFVWRGFCLLEKTKQKCGFKHDVL